MLNRLACTCIRCDRRLGDAEFRLAMRTADGTRHAYECDCGAVTVTVVRE